MPCKHVSFNFSERWIRQAVPASFIAADGFSVTDIPLSHFVSHVGIVRSPCRHVQRSLLRHPWSLRSKIRSAQLANCTLRFFSKNGFTGGARPVQGAPRRLKPVGEASSGSQVRKTNTPFFRMQRYASLNSCLSYRSHTSNIGLAI